MNKSDMNNSSDTNWEMIDALTDETIDRSELPPLDDVFFDKAVWKMPQERVTVSVEMDASLLAWFQALGNDYEQRMLAALRIYARAHTEAIHEVATVL